MPRFSYLARNRQGQQSQGVIEAMDRSAAVTALKAQGLWPTRLDDFAGPPPYAWAAGPLYPLWPIHPADLAQFFSQLSVLVRSGINAHEAMDDAAERVHDRRLRRAAAAMVPALAQGSGLAEEMARFPNFFRSHVVGAIKAGETFGGLPEVLADLAGQFTTEAVLRWRLRWVKLYYGAVLVLAVLVAPFPRMISQGLRWYGLLLLTRLLPGLLLAGLAIALTVVLLNRPRMASLRSRLGLCMPVFGALVRWTALVRFTRALQLSQRAGVTLDHGLEAAGMATGHPNLSRGATRAAELVRGGRSLAEALARVPGLPRRLRDMLAAGERAGGLEESLDTAAQWAEEGRTSSVNAITAGAGIGGLALGAVVVLIALAIAYRNYFNAIFEITDVE